MLSDSVRLISVDDHLIEPPHLWSSRLPKRYIDEGPRVVRDGGIDLWEYASRRYETTGTLAAAGRDVSEFTHEAISFDDMRPGCYEPQARLADMDRANIWGSLSFPTFGRFAGHRFLEGSDRELARLCVSAYNDFVMDEWCATAPDRLIPLIIVPMWDVAECVKEVKRMAARGAKAVALSENPTLLGLPSIHSRAWDAMFAAIADADLTICMHVGSSGQLISSSPDAPYGVHTSLVGLGSMIACSDFIFSHLFHELPSLRVALSEGGAGWVPYLVERMDACWETHRHHSGMQGKVSPRELFASNIWVCVINDAFAIEQRHTIGVDRMMWECDYPHADSLWPNSRESLAKAMVDVPDHEAAAIGEGNARHVFRMFD